VITANTMTSQSVGIFDLVGFTLKAHTAGQRMALGAYTILSLVDHFVRRKLKFLPWRLPYSLVSDVTVSTAWGAFHCRKSTSDGWIAGPLFEPTTRTYLKRVMTTGVFVDVGSHMGRYAVEMARHLRENGRVVAIEPHPQNFQALKRNIELNELKNVVAVNSGCWSCSGSLRLVGADDGATISHEQGLHGHMVPVITVDELIIDRLQLAAIAILKIDVEGAEAEVLRGARRVIESSPRLNVVFEALDDAALERVADILTPSGFKIERLSWKNFVAFREQ